MILKMQKLTLVGFLDEKEAILRELMKKKCVQLQNPEDIQNYESISQLSLQGTAETYELEQDLTRFAAAIKAVSEYVEKPGLFAKKEAAPFSSLLDAKRFDQSAALRDEVNDIVKQIGDRKAGKARHSLQIASLEPWRSLDTDLGETSTKTCSLLYLVIPADVDIGTIEKQLSEASPLFYLREVSSLPESKYFVLLFHSSAQEDVFNVLKGFNTSRPDFSTLHGSVVQNIANLQKDSAQCDKDIVSLTERLKESAKQADVLKTGYDMVALQIDGQNARQKLFHTESVFALSGWCIKDEQDKIKQILDKFQCYYQFVAPAEGEDPPIKLKNNKFCQPYELITEMYSLPAPDGLDPDPLMAPFFILFFGMMLADAGYGLLILGLCLFVLWKAKPDEGFLKNILHMGVGCSISATFWGVIYGGYFGDLVSAVAKGWFGNENLVIPSVMEPLKDPMSVMILAFVLGAIHLFVGMGAKAYLMIKRGHALDAVFDIGFWYLILIGLPMLIIPATVTIGMVLAIGGAVGLILTQGRAEKNIFMKLIKGVMSLYDITSYLSDVLSYSRILALGLAGGVIANVVNLMGTLGGFNIFGVILFVLVFLGGHAFNLAISGLGAYVHTSRLQYVEFFGKFYESGGKPFKPFRANTKYTYLSDKEEI